MPLRNHANIQHPTVARRLVDCVSQVQLVCSAFSRKLSQPAQCDFDVAGSKLDRIIEIAVLAFVPNLYCTAISRRPLLLRAHAVSPWEHAYFAEPVIELRCEEDIDTIGRAYSSIWM